MIGLAIYIISKHFSPFLSTNPQKVEAEKIRKKGKP